jgi:hypothetical protein
MPVPQRVNFLVEQAGKPVHKKLIENGATSQYKSKLPCPLPTMKFPAISCNRNSRHHI